MTPPTTTTARGGRVTLKHVADHAGVSVSTVSDIVNRGRSGNYTDETQQRVRDAIDALGYRVARAAQELRRGRSNTAGVILTHSFENPYYARLFNELKRALEEHGLHTEVVVLNERRVETFRDAWDRMLSHGVEGLIVGPLYYWDEGLIGQLDGLSARTMPMVAFGAVEAVPGMETVVLPDKAGGRIAARHLLDAGHRRIAFLGAYAEADAEHGRGTMQEGFEEALTEAGLLDRQWLIQTPDSGRYETGHADALALGERWLAARPDDRPTAVLCKTDQLAIAALSAFDTLGIEVPAALSVMGYDNVPESGYTVPALTTVDGGLNQRMAELAWRLASLIGGGSIRQRGAVLQPPSPVVRRSVADLDPKDR